MKWHETGLIKKYWKPVLLCVFILISIKPVMFTWHFIRASLAIHLEADRYQAGAAIAGAVSYKPSTHSIFNNTTPHILEQYLAKTAVYANRRQLLETASGVSESPRLRAIFKDNFYVQNLLEGLDQQRDWQYLDNLSLYVLADNRMNHVTIAILEKIAPQVDREFLKNMADYCHWKGNTGLARYLVSTYALGNKPSPAQASVPGGPEAVNAFLEASFPLNPPDVGVNLLRCPGFQEKDRWEDHWYFSQMASRPRFARGSFVMGLFVMGGSHSVEAGSANHVMRLMGFFTGRDAGKGKSRAGVRSRRKYPAENGVYLFSFDYLTVTGSEAASFWLSGELPEKRLPSTANQWKTVVFFLDNSTNAYTSLNPLIRMWGTGTLLVDNISLSKIRDPRFSINGNRTTIISGDAQ